MRKLVDKYFGVDPARRRCRRATISRSRRRPRRARETLQIEVQIPVVVGGYHIPRAADPDLPALEVLAAVLSAGESSRLHQRLVRKDHLAIAAGGVTGAMEDPGLFIVYAAHLPNKDGAQVQAGAARGDRARARQAGRARRARQGEEPAGGGFIFGLQTVDGIATRARRQSST